MPDFSITSRARAHASWAAGVASPAPALALPPLNTTIINADRAPHLRRRPPPCARFSFPKLPLTSLPPSLPAGHPPHDPTPAKSLLDRWPTAGGSSCSSALRVGSRAWRGWALQTGPKPQAQKRSRQGRRRGRGGPETEGSWPWAGGSTPRHPAATRPGGGQWAEMARGGLE